MSVDKEAAFPFRVVPEHMIGEGIPPPEEPEKKCNCRNSKCLKLYCECFSHGAYCREGVCNCTGCHNNYTNRLSRRHGVMISLLRNRGAFRPKVSVNGEEWTDNESRRKRGCHCKKSGCLKKYCECFVANVVCCDSCRCHNCLNFEGSPERDAVIARTAAAEASAPRSPFKGSPRKVGSPVKSPAAASPVKRPRTASSSADESDSRPASTAKIVRPSTETAPMVPQPKVKALGEILSPTLIESFCQRLLGTATVVENTHVPRAPRPAQNSSDSARSATDQPQKVKSEALSPTALSLFCHEDDEVVDVPKVAATFRFGGVNAKDGPLFDGAGQNLREKGGKLETYSVMENAVLSEVSELLDQILAKSEAS